MTFRNWSLSVCPRPPSMAFCLLVGVINAFELECQQRLRSSDLFAKSKLVK